MRDHVRGPANPLVVNMSITATSYVNIISEIINYTERKTDLELIYIIVNESYRFILVTQMIKFVMVICSKPKLIYLCP